ncbi:uncharacterized protein Pyn_38226 [Prunus yedoensis var. nudiflora]|uniref:Fiber protein Fb11 n=1 Tax=Prunus yedoensis var. nudiflora TaxID=2094558 RepID=A0A314ZNV4_PRUYE|nr:uncharacterized protein Pyn_38226 [Prunus yedoensis var. nudiflora]
MAVMEKLRMFVAQEPVVAASCLIAGFGLFLPAVVRPILDSFEASKQVPQPALSDEKRDIVQLDPLNLLHPIHGVLDLVLFSYTAISIEVLKDRKIGLGHVMDGAC